MNLEDISLILEALSKHDKKGSLIECVEKGVFLSKNERIKLFQNWIEEFGCDYLVLNQKKIDILELMISLTHFFRAFRN